jgi:hypothetical protein
MAAKEVIQFVKLTSVKELMLSPSKMRSKAQAKSSKV